MNPALFFNKKKTATRLRVAVNFNFVLKEDRNFEGRLRALKMTAH